MKKTFLLLGTSLLLGLTSCDADFILSSKTSAQIDSSTSQTYNISGHGAPNSSIGNDGEIYLDLDTGDFYVKSGSVWILFRPAQSSSSQEPSTPAPEATSVTPTPGSSSTSPTSTPEATSEPTPEQSSSTPAQSSSTPESPSSSSASASSSSSSAGSSSASSSSSSDAPDLSGAGRPAANTGSVGQTYLDTRTGDRYVKTSLDWSTDVLTKPVEDIVFAADVTPSSTPIDTSDKGGYHQADISKSTLNRSSLGVYNEDPVLTSRGKPKLLVLPIEFGSMPFGQSRLKDIKTAVAGTSESTNYWESLKSFYAKSSYGNLNMDFVFADPYVVSSSPVNWYNANKKGTAADYGGGDTMTYEDSPTCLPQLAMAEAVDNYKSKTGDDCKQFDTDSDGYIDAVIMLYSTPNSSKASYSSSLADTFWAYQYTDQTFPEGDVSSPVGFRYFWASYDFFYSGVAEGEGVDAHTLIHEMGHILGADDYYNYAPKSAGETSEPSGCLIMMSHNVADHDAFSKLDYGWVNPYVVDGNCEITIRPMESSGDCILLADSWNGTSFDEYVLFELYTPTGLNQLDSTVGYEGRSKAPSEAGVRVWHIDNRLAYGEEFTDKGILDGVGLVSDSQIIDWESTSASWIDDYYVMPTVTNTAYYDGNLIQNKGYELIQFVLAGSINTTKSGKTMKNADLFQTGDSFTLASYSAFFPEKTKLNNGNALNYSVSFDSVSSESATLTFTKTA